MAEHAFEFYRLLVEEVREARRARRELSNMFLTLNTAGVGAMGFLAQGDGSLDPALMAVLAGALALTCIIWRTSNSYYTLLLAAKYRAIYALEGELGRHPIREEWEALQGKRRTMKWFSLERMMPVLFIVAYVLFVAIQTHAVDFAALEQQVRELFASLMARFAQR
jgi:hypothetical protein